MSDQRSKHLTRPFLAGVLGFTVQCGSAEVCNTIEALFNDLGEPPPGLPLHELRLDEVEQNGIRMLELSGCGEFDPGPLGSDWMLDILVSRVGRLSLDADADRLHLHAAALAREGRGVLVSASGGTGKTTLSAALVLRGWDYLTDETVALVPGEATITGFAKPLTIKHTGRDLFADFADRRVALGPSNGTSWHVPASRLGGQPIVAAMPALLVFLSRTATDVREQAPPSSAPVHPADAVVLLVQESLDVGRFGESALPLIADLASRCGSVQVEAGTPAATAQLVEQLLADAAGSGCPPPVLLPRGARSNYATEVTVADSVVSVALDGIVVTHDVRTGKIASFDKAGSAVWSALHGHAPKERALPEPESAGVRSFLRDLEREGFVTRGADEAVAVGVPDVT